MGEIASISSEFILGYLMDLFGRKHLNVGGLIVASIAVFCKPLPQQIGYLYAFRILTNVGLLPMLYTPYILDYVRKQSLGLLMGYQSAIATLSNIISTTGTI